MDTKPLTFLLAFNFLFFFAGASVVLADDFQDGLDAYLEQDFIHTIHIQQLDFKTTYKLVSSLAEQGNAISQFHMGIMYEIGEGVAQDFKEAVKWYYLAAKQGYGKAQFKLGLMYSKGKGVPPDRKEATKWLLKIAEQKNEKAQRLIRTHYHQWHKQIAEQGDSYAQRFLGASYYLGLEITQDYTEAAKWYKKAAEQKDRVAQNILGAMYEKGKGISRDFVEAYKWFSLSEDAGNEFMYKEKIGKQKMTSAQIVEAQKLAREWRENYQKN